MKRYLLYLSILYAGLFSACENDLTFQPGKDLKAQLIMNTLLEAGAEENVVFLNISGLERTRHIADGSVTVYVNGEEKETVDAERLNSFEDGIQKVCRLKTKFQPGDVIRLKAVAEKEKYHVSAEVKVPQPIDEIRVDTLRTQLKIGNYMDNCIRYKITINDRPGEKDYYRLIIQEDQYWGDPDEGWEYEPSISEPDIINQEDVVLTDGHLTTADDEEYGIIDMSVANKYNVFTDSRFRDGSYTLKVYTRYSDYPHFAEENHIVVYAQIRILSITEAEHRYLRAMNCLESDNYDAAYMEPVIIPSNVEGGLGFVGACSDSRVKIRIVDRPPLRPKRQI